ncbi:DUF4189 domain-containing protein [Nocardia cyriacigeorgica]|nr:DUF4189 domain-containing protein [Nocardia cyriacigeorgica]MBF6096784.1 DUF4189 domain-containing protein [Nocardia cyriacigeorgica]MBF6162594.1 DUF4189 domain-containing protein [Nocardia cyriacigeorgica]MBF6198053.1 DUF4189 domain-containing protein [Nocardia cyriacigeorgica]MBF6316916.1 DUF4189 domain-containing protein [Nocardia cyriacigeorgica]MBF6396339.1 DUF4189 domain-containing protein [Nocardia cyriacigeorgica]
MRLMGNVGFAVAVAGLAAGSVLGAGTASAASQHAAIAVNPGKLVYGVSVNAASTADAESAAIADCGTDGCEVAASWANGCGVLMESNEATVVASGATRADAERNAYQRISEVTPTAVLGNTGSANLSGVRIVEVVCTANAR